MSLLSLINQHALSAAQSGDWATVASTLNALSTEVRVTELRTARWLMLQLTDVVRTENGIPLTEADIVLGTLQSAAIPRVKAAYDSLCNGGLDLSEDQVQQMIPVLAAAGSWPSGLAEKVMQAGKRPVRLLDADTTALACEAAWKTEQRRLRDVDLKTRFDAILNQLGSVENAAGIQALRDMANEFEVQE